MTGSLARGLALVDADLRAGRRALRGVPAGPWVSAAVSAALGALAVAGGAAAGAVVAQWRAEGAVGAASGAVDAALASLFAAALVAPVVGAGAARLRALARRTGAPVEGTALLAAVALREVLSAPLFPALALACGAAAGSAHGVLAVAHALVVVLLLASLGLAAGTWAERVGRGALLRPVVVLLALVLVAAVAGGGLGGGDDVRSWLEAVHARRAAAALSPSGWAATAIHTGGAAAWWAPAGLLALTAWAAAVTHGRPPAAAEEGAPGRRGAAVPRRQWPPSAFGALVSKDLRLLRREPAIRAAVLRGLGPAALPALAVLCSAAAARGDAVAAARLHHLVPHVGLLGALAVVGLAGATGLLPALDGGGASTLAGVPVPVRRLALARAVAWTALAAPLAAVVLAGIGGGVAAVAGAPPLGTAVQAGLEAASAVAAGAGAGLLAAALRVLPAASPGGVLRGVAGSLLTVLAVAPTALAFHALAPPLGALVGALAGPAAGGLLTLAAAALLQARSEPGPGGPARLA